MSFYTTTDINSYYRCSYYHPATIRADVLLISYNSIYDPDVLYTLRQPNSTSPLLGEYEIKYGSTSSYNPPDVGYTTEDKRDGINDYYEYTCANYALYKYIKRSLMPQYAFYKITSMNCYMYNGKITYKFILNSNCNYLALYKRISELFHINSAKYIYGSFIKAAGSTYDVDKWNYVADDIQTEYTTNLRMLLMSNTVLSNAQVDLMLDGFVGVVSTTVFVAGVAPDEPDRFQFRIGAKNILGYMIVKFLENYPKSSDVRLWRDTLISKNENWAVEISAMADNMIDSIIAYYTHYTYIIGADTENLIVNNVISPVKFIESKIFKEYDADMFDDLCSKGYVVGNLNTELDNILRQIVLTPDGTTHVISPNGIGIGEDYSFVGYAAEDVAKFYMRDHTAWVFTQELQPAAVEVGSNFGGCIAFNNDANDVIISASRKNNGGTLQGSVYTFRLNAGVWEEKQELKSPDPADNDFFGSILCISKDGLVLAIGAPDKEGIGTDRGGVYMYQNIANTWTYVNKLLPSDAADNDTFGSCIDMSEDGGTVIIGSSLKDNAGTNQGAAYIFEFGGAVWAQSQKLVPTDPNDSDYFGASVAYSNDYVAILSANNNDGVYIFDTATWTEQKKITGLHFGGVIGYPTANFIKFRRDPVTDNAIELYIADPEYESPILTNTTGVIWVSDVATWSLDIYKSYSNAVDGIIAVYGIATGFYTDHSYLIASHNDDDYGPVIWLNL